MAELYPITGVTTGVYTRLDLRELEKKPIQWSLFIQAMSKIHDKVTPDKPNSWMQIGSIHGLPYTPWSGDPKGPQESVSQKWGGYCYHASALFPPWHRVLLLLVEQALVEQAIAIAAETNNAEWIQAAKELRFPYWDWTRAETAEEGIPKVCQEPKINIVTVGGSTVEVDNPLNHYKFATSPGETDNAKYMATWPRTYRWVNQDINPTEEQYAKAQKAFAEGGTIKVGDQTEELQPLHWLRAKVAALFTYDLTVTNPGYGGNMWGFFSNTGATADKINPVMPTMPPSLEEPHNQVHLHCGGNGSMSLNEYAGFDPIFFLHHCNVDRIYSLWEYLYPEYWVANGWVDANGNTKPFITDDGTFYQEPGTDVNNLTPCHPFRNSASEYWTSEEVRGLLKNLSVNKYYTYPPVTDPRTGTQIKVDTPYDPNNLAIREQYRQILYNEFSPDFDEVIQHHQRLSILSPVHAVHANLLMRQADGFTHLRHFFIVGELPEFAFPGSYRLELYELNRGSEVHVVNSISVLARADPDRCAACVSRRAAGNTVRGHMPLDPRLIVHLIGKLHFTRLAAITELTHLAALLHGSFGARLVKPDGTLLAGAGPNVPSQLSVLQASKTPKLSLHSHVVQFKHTDGTAPIRFHGHSDHGAFGTDSVWRAY